MEQWVEVEVFREDDAKEAQKQHDKMIDLALDAGFAPEKVVRLLSTPKGLSLQVDNDFFDYCRGF